MNSSTSDRELRIEQIARTILYRCFGNITIERMPENGRLDLLVGYNDGTDLKFGVILKSGAYHVPRTQDCLIEEVSSIDFSQERYRMPIIVMHMDEPTESAKVGFLVGWRFGKPTIYRNFELRSLNQKTADVTLQIIKSMDNVIRVLSTNNLNVQKQIVFSRKLSDNRVQQAKIIYLRKLSASYRMQQKEIVDEKERFERLLKGIPEEEYPQDELDDLIYGAVKQHFKNAKVKSKLMLLSTDLEDLQYYKKEHCHHTTLQVSPDLTNIPQVALCMLDGLEMFHVELDVYVENIFYANAFDNVSFEKEEPLEGWVKKVTMWNELKKTMSPISAFFK